MEGVSQLRPGLLFGRLLDQMELRMETRDGRVVQSNLNQVPRGVILYTAEQVFHTHPWRGNRTTLLSLTRDTFLQQLFAFLVLYF